MRIKNWAKLQHFKDRRPPWVKLYRDILDDPDWHELDAESAKILVMLWLIASEDEEQQGNLPDTKKLAFRLRITQKHLEKVCINLSHWLIQDDIAVISDRYQVDAPERAREETETETETETYKPETETKTSRAPRFDAQAHLVSIGVDASIAADWIQSRNAMKAKPTLTAINAIANEAERSGTRLSDVLAICCQRGWRGFKAEWLKNGDQEQGAIKTQYQINQEATARAIFGTRKPANEPRVITGEVVS